jgi:hypothetical protein
LTTSTKFAECVGAVQLTLIVYPAAPEPGVRAVVVMVTTCEAPVVVGVRLKVRGDAARPVTAGTVTVQLTDVATPEVRVVTTLGAVLVPAVIVAVVGLHATE